MNSEELRKRKEKIMNNLDDTLNALDKGYEEAKRVHAVVSNTEQILDDLDYQFELQTGLTSTDVAFLFLATGLQIARQYLLSNEKGRISASEGDKLMDSALSLAPPDWKEILTQSVPYDAFHYSRSFNIDPKLSGANHRFRTLGHDPILGWIFGTANILTNSLTKVDFETFQVKNMLIIRHYPLGVTGMLERAVKYSCDDPKLLAVALARQAIHFGSDYFTEQGLPVPFIATVDNKLAQNMLTKWNLDMMSVVRGATLANFINDIISIVHILFYDGTTEQDRKLYEVRTRKIISYSNAMATSSNVAYVLASRDLQKLDVGGMAVTIYRLITDANYIREMKREFIFGSYKHMVLGDAF